MEYVLLLRRTVRAKLSQHTGTTHHVNRTSDHTNSFTAGPKWLASTEQHLHSVGEIAKNPKKNKSSIPDEIIPTIIPVYLVCAITPSVRR